jgi:hypothetical protein
MKLVVGMNNGLGLIRSYSNDGAFARVETRSAIYFPVRLGLPVIVGCLYYNPIYGSE